MDGRGERYDRCWREGRCPLDRVGVVRGSGRRVRILGIAGVGALSDAVGAKSISTSSISKLSSLSSVGIRDVEGVLLDAVGVLNVESFRPCFAKGDSGLGLERFEGWSGLFPLLSSDRPNPKAVLNEDEAFGVRGVVGGVALLEDEDDGRVIADCLVGAAGNIFAALTSRAEGLLGE